jgi:hypothetical protein
LDATGMPAAISITPAACMRLWPPIG